MARCVRAWQAGLGSSGRGAAGGVRRGIARSGVAGKATWVMERFGKSRFGAAGGFGPVVVSRVAEVQGTAGKVLLVEARYGRYGKAGQVLRQKEGLWFTDGNCRVLFR